MHHINTNWTKSSNSKILHTCTEECPGQPSHPINYEQVRNYLLDKNEIQKKNHDQNHNVKPLPKLIPGQKVLFLSPKEQSQYIEGTITTKASIPRSYYVESQGKTYCSTHEHICTINTDIPVLQDHQQPQIPVSQDHQHKHIPVSQDHQQSQHHKYVPVSQDHCHKKVAVSQDHHSVPSSQDHQPRYKPCKLAK